MNVSFQLIQLLGKCQETQLLDHLLGVYLFCKKPPNSSKVAVQF